MRVDQVDFGHVARKPTLLYIVGAHPSAVSIPRERRQPTHWISGFRSSTHRNIYAQSGSAVPPGIKICSAQQRRRTPRDFAHFLVALARSAERRAA